MSVSAGISIGEQAVSLPSQLTSLSHSLPPFPPSLSLPRSHTQNGRVAGDVDIDRLKLSEGYINGTQVTLLFIEEVFKGTWSILPPEFRNTPVENRFRIATLKRTTSKILHFLQREAVGAGCVFNAPDVPVSIITFCGSVSVQDAGPWPRP